MKIKKELYSKVFLQLSIITFLTFAIWSKTLNQTMWGDGFYWFNPLFRDFNIFPINLSHTSYNVMMRIVFDWSIKLFGANIIYYQLMQILFLFLLTISIYIATLKLTKKTLISFSTCVIFVSNYGGVYEMIGEGNLNRFLERIPNLIIVISAIFFLVNFLEKKKIRDLILSWVLFTVGIYLGHFSTFALPFFCFYPVIYNFNIKKVFKSLFSGGLIASLFALTNFLIIRNSDQRSGGSFFSLLNPSQRFIEKTFLMITPLIIPQEIVINIAKKLSIPYPYISLVQFYTVILLILSLIIGFLLYKKNRLILKIYLASLLTIITSTALTIYTDPVKYNPFRNFGAGRDVFIQSIFYAIILSCLLVVFFKKRTKSFPIIVFIFLTTFVIYNVNLTWQTISNTQYLYEGEKKYLAYIRELYPKFNSKTSIVVSSTLMPASAFIDDFYGPPVVNFASAPEDIKKILNQDKDNTYVIGIDYNETPEGTFPTYGGKIVDLSNLYRKGKLDLLSDWNIKKIKDLELSNN